MSVKTTSLETSKLLKDSGFKEYNSEYYYERAYSVDTGKEVFHLTPQYRTTPSRDYRIAAPTTDELLEVLSDEALLTIINETFPTHDKLGRFFEIIRDPNKLADCWLWLRKENVL